MIGDSEPTGRRTDDEWCNNHSRKGMNSEWEESERTAVQGRDEREMKGRQRLKDVTTHGPGRMLYEGG